MSPRPRRWPPARARSGAAAPSHGRGRGTRFASDHATRREVAAHGVSAPSGRRPYHGARAQAPHRDADDATFPVSRRSIAHASALGPRALEPARVITRPINLATTIHAPSPVSAARRTASRCRHAAAAPQHTPPPMPAPSIEGASDPILASIYRLADQGIAPTEIAQQLNQPIGKVELVLALRQD